MMKKVLFIVAAATLFFSCQKEIEPATPDSASGERFIFKASTENLVAPTKADINASNQLVWAEGDKIGVYVNDDGWPDKNQPFTLVGNGGDVTGDFAWDYSGEFSQNAAAAFYPWGGTGSDANNVYDGTMYFKLPDGYYGYTSGKMVTPLVAKLNGSTDKITFKHAGAAVKVTINNLPGYVHSLGMSVAGQQITGGYHIDPASAGTAALAIDGAADATKNSVWLNIDPADAEREFVFLFPVPELTKPKLSFSMYDENDVLVWSKNLKAQSVDVSRGDVLEMPALDIEPSYQLDQISVWGVIGTHNNWDGDTPMACEVDGIMHVAKGLVCEQNAEFKIRKDGNWDESYGNGNLIDNDYSVGEGSNVKITTAGTYDIIFNSKTHKIKVTPTGRCPYPDAATMPHHSAIKKAKDLGATETANCYIITAPGAYKIPVVKGNSSESAGERASVELLWETYNNAESVTPNSVIAAVDYDDEDNYVYFKTPDTLKPGNALIAAKDANGDIIWSWHIWIPATEIESSTYGYIYNHELMDRNLGALVAATTTSIPVESFGLHYEWGRKDPFVGAKSITSSSFASVSGTAITTGYGMTVEQAIANPTVYAVYTESDSWGNWTNETGASTLWQNAEKTIYDPCPAGYRVPARDSGQPMHSSDLSTVTGWSDNAASGANAAYFTLGNPAAVFPFAGLLSEDGSNISYNGARDFIWTTYASSSSNSGYMMDVRQGTSTHTVTSTVTSRGCSVRCVKIEAAPEPEVEPAAAATGITLDGDLSDWDDNGEALAGDGSSIIEWKYGYDSSNLYFFFKIPTSKIVASDDGTYKFKRYIYIALDTDNDESTGASPSDYGALTLPGCEALALVYPFRGDTTEGLAFVNGLDDAGWTRVPPTGSKTGKYATTYGVVNGSYAYVEVGLPMDGIGTPSPSKMKVQLSYSWTLSPIGTISTK